MVATAVSDKRTLNDPRAKILSHEVWDGEPDTLYAAEFAWEMIISNADASVHAIFEGRLTADDASSGNMLLVFVAGNTALFQYLYSRISADSDAGKQLRSDVMLAIKESELTMNDGYGLKQFFRTIVVFKTQPEIDGAEALLNAVKIPLGASELKLKQLATAVQATLLRMPDHSRGHKMRPFKIMLNALPAECMVERRMLENQLGINSVFTTTCTLPKWSTFVTHLGAALSAATSRASDRPMVQSNLALAAFVPPSNTALVGVAPGAPSLPGQYKRTDTGAGGGKGGDLKCFNCAGDHLSRDCTKKPCGKCGKRFCGALRDLPCMVENGVPDGAKGVDGKPLKPHIKERIERVRAAIARQQANLAVGGEADAGALALLAGTFDSSLALVSVGGANYDELLLCSGARARARRRVLARAEDFFFFFFSSCEEIPR